MLQMLMKKILRVRQAARVVKTGFIKKELLRTGKTKKPKKERIRSL